VVEVNNRHDFNVMRNSIINKGISTELVKNLSEKQVERIYHIVKGLCINNDKNERTRDE